jgi:hypothetical protein
MSGQPQPPRIEQPFAAEAGADYITNPFPVASQIAITPGAASLTDGFPPICFIVGDGGIPPTGDDFNGILFLLSSWVAYLAAGQLPLYDATLQTAMGGYAIGARLQQAGNPLAAWVNAVAGNTTDPDTGGAGWISSTILYSNVALTGVNNVVLPGISDYIIDVDCSGGAIAFTGFVAQRDGQKITFRKSDSSGNALTFVYASGASSAPNQFQIIPAGISIPIQYGSGTFQHNAVLNKWIQV